MAKILVVMVCAAAIASLTAFGVMAIDSGIQNGSATFYGDMTARETMGGACGYGNLIQQGYGFETAALSTALFNNGLTCGACYEVWCYNDPEWCVSGSIKITATNYCPPDPSKPNDNGGWCNPPRKHFDLSMPMFVKLVRSYRAGIIPIQFRRVACVKKGGIKFEINGNPYFILVLVYNVAGAGDVTAVSIKGSQTGWSAMIRNWGQNWATDNRLVGQSLSFRVTDSDGKVVESIDVAPSSWLFGQVFEGKQL